MKKTKKVRTRDNTIIKETEENDDYGFENNYTDDAEEEDQEGDDQKIKDRKIC